MKKAGILAAAATAALLTASGIALAAKSWNLTGEEIVRFDGKIIDALCAIAGDCPPDCGAGRRQLGILTADDTFYLAVKNFGPFTGATDDLLEFCNQQVTVDGLFSSNHGAKVFALHFVKAAKQGAKWRKANRWGPKWAERNGLKANDKKQNRWFKYDPRVEEIIERDGFLGLGEEADGKFLADY